jgi:hypothetical protein
MADSILTVEQAQTAIERSPLAFVAAVGWVLALTFIALFIKVMLARHADAMGYAASLKDMADDHREVSVKTLTTVALATEVLKTVKPQKRRQTNPRLKAGGAP